MLPHVGSGQTLSCCQSDTEGQLRLAGLRARWRHAMCMFCKPERGTLCRARQPWPQLDKVCTPAKHGVLSISYSLH